MKFKNNENLNLPRKWEQGCQEINGRTRPENQEQIIQEKIAELKEHILLQGMTKHQMTQISLRSLLKHEKINQH